MAPRARRFVLACGLAVVLLVLAEGAARLLPGHETERELARLREHLLEGTVQFYEPHPYRVYQLRRASAEVNEHGFGDVEWSVERTPGVPRIACLGGSTTQSGNNSGRRGSYPFLLEKLLEREHGFDFEVLNAGIASWTSAEMLIAWFLTLQDFAPDVVVLHEAVNDVEPRLREGFRSDYWHWRTPLQVRGAVGLERWLARESDLYLLLRRRGGSPTLGDVATRRDAPFAPASDEAGHDHATSLPFRRNILSIAESARAGGALVVLMTLPVGPHRPDLEVWRAYIAQHNAHLRELAGERGYLLADAEQAFGARPALAAQFTDIVHLEPAGNAAKAQVVAATLAGWIAGLGREGRPPPPQPRERRRPRAEVPR
jgi:lysophospholipase L1-like esterase